MPQKDCVFNRTVRVDIMKIHKQFILYVVAIDKKPAAATLFDGESSERVR